MMAVQNWYLTFSLIGVTFYRRGMWTHEIDQKHTYNTIKTEVGNDTCGNSVKFWGTSVKFNVILQLSHLG